MSTADDYSLALKLQKEFSIEFNEERNGNDTQSFAGSKRKRSEHSDTDLNSTVNIVHPEWEIRDPTPDIFALFMAFDNKFFQGKLKCVELEWSKKMYSCAGICYQRRNAAGKSCIIRLSEPLLKLRSRKNLVETLLHEMIHAYLFILNIRESNGGHGPNFKKIMFNINKTTGTNITVYHTFYDEVNLYKTHVWRCNGICQHRKPFFGYVRRTSNRAPGPNDQWWHQHKSICGGYFAKISEPEPKKTVQRKHNFTKNIPKIDSPKFGFSKTISPTITNQTNINHTSSYPKITSQSKIGGSLINIVGFKYLEGSKSPAVTKKVKARQGNNINQVKIRDVWNAKYPVSPKSNTLNVIKPSINNIPSNESSQNNWQQIDDDLMINDVKPIIIDLLNDSDDIFNNNENKPKTKIIKQTSNELSQTIKKEILDSLDQVDDSDIELIDNDFDDDLLESSAEFSDVSVIDDIFGADTLMSDFNEINDVIMQDEENKGKPDKEIITCPICQEKMSRDNFQEHLDGCLGISVKIMPRSSKYKNTNNVQTFSKKNRPSTSKKSERQILLDCGYSDDVIEKVLKEQAEEREYNKRILKEISSEVETTTENHPCPICSKLIKADQINEHLDICLQNDFN